MPYRKNQCHLGNGNTGEPPLQNIMAHDCDDNILSCDMKVKSSTGRKFEIVAIEFSYALVSLGP